MGESGQEVLEALLAGNARFREGRSVHRRYSQEEIGNYAAQQMPSACVIACSDSRVCPEIIFDQPLGALFVARVPGNVCCDSAKWTIDIAVGEFSVPLLMVVGHTGCLAVTQVVTGEGRGEGGPLRLSIMASAMRVQSVPLERRIDAAIEQNALRAIDDLSRESWALRRAIDSGTTECVAAVYDIHSGKASTIALPSSNR